MSVYDYAYTINRKNGLALLISPVQWISAYMNALLFIMNGTSILQTSKPESVEHLIDIINVYRVRCNCSRFCIWYWPGHICCGVLQVFVLINLHWKL